MEESTPNLHTSLSKSDYWQEQIEAWKTSGLTQPVFCQQRQLSYSTFVYWRTKLNMKKHPTKNKKIQPVKIPLSTSTSLMSCLRIRMPGGIIIEVPSKISGTELRQLFQCLGVKCDNS